jgi:nitrogen regulatory protein PII-like uncharacterized protein
MIYRDPKCVYVADSVGLAEVVVLFLGERNVAARTMNLATLGGFVGLTWLSKRGVSASGIEVWVQDIADADKARRLLADYDARLTAKVSRRQSSGPIEATCEACGEKNICPGSEAGKVINCSHCNEYIDVPDFPENPDY